LAVGVVLVVDPDDDHRADLARLLRRASLDTVEAVSADEALGAAREHRPSLVVLEVVLAEGNGYELCRELREQFGERLPIVFVSAARTESYDRTAGLMVGADDYITRPYDPDEFIARTRRLLDRTPAEAGGDSPLLTGREREVLTLLVEGLTQKEIARQLSISFRTVGKHIEHILAKLDAHTRTQAVVRAVRERLV
jgi:two-component system, NarL family, nitrate/nitrite response regulator NarL